MATASTGWGCTNSAKVISYNDTTDTIRVECFWQNSGWNYSVSNVSAYVYCNGVEKQVKWSSSVSAPSNYGSYSMGYADFVVDKTTSNKNVPCYAKIVSNSTYAGGTKSSGTTYVSTGAKTSYTISYNANNGSGAPANQTKWYGTNLTLSSTKPTRTGYSFVRWNTKTDNTGTGYNPGGTYSANAAATLYAIWKANTYTVTFNANGGSGAPSNQTKTYGTDLTLSSTKPTRTNYNFLGWSTSQNGSVVYAAGGKYTNNAPVTLYAVWELAYLKPRITELAAQRCTSNGTASESGTYIKIIFKWATDRTVSAIKIDWKKQTDTTWSDPVSVTATGTSGSVSQVVGAGKIDSNTTWNIRASVSDSGGTTPSPNLTIPTQKFIIDIKNGGTGAAFGKAAETSNLLDIAWKTRLRGGLDPIVLDVNSDLNSITTVNFYTGRDASTASYSNCPVGSGTFYLEVASVGNGGQIMQTLTSCDPTNGKTFRRFYSDSTWNAWQKLIPNGVADYGSIDPDTTLSPLVLTETNTPTDGSYYIMTLFYAGKTTSNNRTQIAVPYIYDITHEVRDIYIRQNVGGTWNKWQLASSHGVTLYNNASGASGTITLSQDVSNFRKLAIVYGCEYYVEEKIIHLDRCPGEIPFEYFWRHSPSEAAGHFSNWYSISGKSLTLAISLRYYFYSHNSKPTIDNDNGVKVYKVIGYK